MPAIKNTSFREQSSLEKRIDSAKQFLPPPHFVVPDIPYGIYVIPCLDSILSQINKVHNLQIYFFKIHFNIILHLHVGRSDSKTGILRTFLFAHILHAASIPASF
jgi:hypothetical protein